jgi:hypothetical protein
MKCRITMIRSPALTLVGLFTVSEFPVPLAVVWSELIQTGMPMISAGALKYQSKVKLPAPEQLVMSVLLDCPANAGLLLPTSVTWHAAFVMSRNPLELGGVLVRGQVEIGVQLVDEPPARTVMVRVSVNGRHVPLPSGSFEVRVSLTVPE